MTTRASQRAKALKHLSVGGPRILAELHGAGPATLESMIEDGLVEAAGEGVGGRTTYRLTETGRAASLAPPVRPPRRRRLRTLPPRVRTLKNRFA
ncbi:MAG: hypothetical protein AAF192_18960 [Pseudomonadota bacterium]